MAKDQKPTEAIEPQPDTSSTEAMMQVIATDEFAGQGGSYIYDPATGKRTRVEEKT